MSLDLLAGRSLWELRGAIDLDETWLAWPRKSWSGDTASISHQDTMSPVASSVSAYENFAPTAGLILVVAIIWPVR